MTTIKKPAIIINLASGSTSDISEDIAAMFADHNFPEPIIHAVEPSQLDAAFKKVADDGTDLMVVYGGDGTCKSGAIVARDLDIPFVALPGGTMNMLPKALYGTDVWEEALALALSKGEARWFPAGKINEMFFFCGAIIGDPIKIADARESVRDGDLLDAIKQIPEVVSSITGGETFIYQAGGQDYVRDTNLLQISAPKSTSAKLMFELASVPRMTISDILDVGARALIEGWRESEHVHSDFVKKVSVKGQGAFEILLDGEPAHVSCPVNISVVEKGVKVLAPDTL